MIIEEAKIFSFGKLQNVSFRFEEGINVIYGANEQGKTTLHAFLIGMLFGMEKGRGRSARADAYSRYEPWHAPSFYSGALRFRVDGKPFYLERNFYSKDKREYLRNEADKEELNVAYGDLDMLLGGIGREEFENTYDIPQSGAVTGKAMAELLSAYLAEAESGGNGSVSMVLAKKNLAAQKKECMGELKGLREARRKVLEQKEFELGIQNGHRKELQEQIRVFEEKQQELSEKFFTPKDIAVQKENFIQKQNSFQEKKSVRKENRRIRPGAGIVLLVLTIITGIFVFLGMLPVPVVIGMGLLTIVIIMIQLKGISNIHRREAEENTLDNEPEKDDKEENNDKENEILSHAKEMLAQLKEHLQEIENLIINIEEEKRRLEQIPFEELELQEDIAALELAERCMEKIAEEYYLEVSDELNAEISRFVSLLTMGTYDSAGLDKDGMLWILTGEREVAPEALSRGTLEQIYLALRLAAGTVMMPEEEMPIFLDEAFAMYDDKRLIETLKVLAGTKKQIFLFTCQKREEALLRWEEIPYHVINMGEEERKWF